MKGTSDVCQSLARRNLDRLPETFLYRPGEPGRDGLQEIFWACTLELIDQLLGGPAPPAEVRAGREQLVLALDPAAWTALVQEFGLNDEAVRSRTAIALAAQLVPPVDDAVLTAMSASPLSKFASSRLLGLVLFILHLDVMERNGPPRTYRLDTLALSDVSRRHPCPPALGPIDGMQALREFTDYAAVRPRNEWTLKTAYYAFMRPLRLRLAGRSYSPPPLPAEPPLPADFLLKALADQGPAAATVAPTPTTPAWGAVGADVLEELNRLRAENDRLRGLSLAHGLTALLEPLLEKMDDPLAALDSGDAELMRKLLHALTAFLHRPEVELFGKPGEELQLQLPQPEYRLDDAVPPSQRLSPSGWFRVTRRGLRLNKTLVAPAHVVPCPARQA
jgi:hypothetical protein